MTPLPGSGPDWWETAAAAGSSLAVHALIAASAAPALRRPNVERSTALTLWRSARCTRCSTASSTRHEDARGGQLEPDRLLRLEADAAARIAELARERAIDAARGLPRGRIHAIVLRRWSSYYLWALRAPDAQRRMSAPRGQRRPRRPSTPALRVFALRDSPRGSRRSRRVAKHRALKLARRSGVTQAALAPAAVVEPRQARASRCSSCVELVKHYSRSAVSRSRAVDGVSLSVAGRRDGRAVRAERLGQDDAAADGRDAARADERRRARSAGATSPRSPSARPRTSGSPSSASSARTSTCCRASARSTTPC